MTGRREIFQQRMNQGHSAAWDQLWDQAAEQYRLALDEFPDDPQALINLALALYELQEFEQASQFYQKAARSQPDKPLPFEKLAQVFERQGKLDRASQAALHAAELYLKDRDVDKAIENWMRITKLDPENLVARSRLALVYEKMGQKEKAVQEYIAVASLMQKKGDLEKAAAAIQQAMRILPDNPLVLQAFALLRARKPLPRPSRPRGGTAPLRMSQVRQLQPSLDAHKQEKSLDPVSQASRQALTQLASMLFETPEEEPESSGQRLGLQALFQGVGTPARPADRSRIALHLSQVVDLQTQERYLQAADDLSKAIEAGLNTSAAYFDLGFLMVKNGQPEKAISNLQAALKQPDFALGAHLLLGDVFEQAGRIQEAAIEYLEALKVADSQVVAPEVSHELRQLYDPIIEAYRQAMEPQAYTRLVGSIRELLVRPGWLENLQKARRQLPQPASGSLPMPLAEILTEASSGQIVESLAKISALTQNGQLRSAMEETLFALQHAPTYLSLHIGMADLLMREGRMVEAAEKYETIARTYTIRGEPERAIDLYHRIIELLPTNLAVRSRFIDQLVACGRVSDAIQQLSSLAEVYYSLADLEKARKTYTEALRLAQQSKIDRSLRIQILHRMADIDLQSLDWRQALRIFEQIRTLQPDDDLARSSLVLINFRLGQESAGIEELDNAVSHLANSGQPERAIQFLETLIQENPEMVSIRRRLAEGYRQVGRLDDAIREFDMVGDLLLQAGDRKGAIHAVEAILAMDPENREDYQDALTQLRG